MPPTNVVCEVCFPHTRGGCGANDSTILMCWTYLEQRFVKNIGTIPD